MTTSSETLGRRIARLRLAKTATQERLAKELNVSPQAVSKWENDINYPDISLLPDLARFLGVSVDELLSGASASTQELLPRRTLQLRRVLLRLFPLQLTSLQRS